MTIKHEILELETCPGIGIYNITPEIEKLLETTGIKNRQAIVFSRHTTTALAINENEDRLLEDVKVHLRKLAPESGKYLHNDLHLRSGAPRGTRERSFSSDGDDVEYQRSYSRIRW